MDVKPKLKLGDAVRFARKNYGLTQKELGRLAGLTENYITLVESGHRELGLRPLRALAKVFGIPAALLLALADISDPAGGEHSRLLAQVQLSIRTAIEVSGSEFVKRHTTRHTLTTE